ncbi:hypothetical protein P43SY_008176 [Pythium insidiosum]|uniref:HTH CENPB-type domain-containing protein n=1 Tax=Pythium insidiosum TaxID=114742 RepID=A0AAD5LVU0_PYTIN|nr:hypothetical protein P43SY_008176 [Pythium insidiosum]
MASQQSTASQRRERSQGSATTLSRDQEEEVVVWINQLRKDGIPVSATMLRLKACQVAEDAGIRGFHATWSWRRRFLKRHQLSTRARTRQGQVTSAEAEGILLAFCKRVLQRIIAHNVAMLYNADQTAVFFEYIPRTTISKRGEKTVWVRCAGKEKDRMTAMLLGDWEGNKAAPFVVLKAQSSRISARQVENEALRHGFGKRSWKAVQKATQGRNLVVYGNPKGWWNEKLSLKFLAYHFGHRSASDRPVMLLWDDMSAHWTQAVLDYAASKAVLHEKVPPKFTFCCQPADVAWNKPFKDRLRARWFQHLRNDMATMQRVTAPKKHDVLQWLNEAWASLSVSTIVNGFVKCGLLTRHIPADAPVESVVADAALIAALERSRALDQRTTSEDDDVGDGENDSGAVDADANTGDTVVPTGWHAAA